MFNFLIKIYFVDEIIITWHIRNVSFLYLNCHINKNYYCIKYFKVIVEIIIFNEIHYHCLLFALYLIMIKFLKHNIFRFWPERKSCSFSNNLFSFSPKINTENTLIFVVSEVFFLLFIFGQIFYRIQ